MMNEVEKIYLDKVRQHRNNLIRHKSQARQLSWLRLIVFVGGCFILIWAFRVNLYLFFSLLTVFIGCFVLLLKMFSRKMFSTKLEEQYILLNNNELKSLKGDYSCFDPGNEFIDRLHPYSFDLDIVGDGSLFHAINRATTLKGKKELAAMMLAPLPSKSSIEKTQDAVKELKTKVDWRQKFQAYGNLYKEDIEDIPNINAWLEMPATFLAMEWYIVLAYVSALATIVTLTLAISGQAPYSVASFALLIEILVLLIPLRKVNDHHRKVSKILAILKNYSDLLRIIEEEEFKYILNKLLQTELKLGKETASGSISSLTMLIDALDNRMNPIAGFILNLFFLWDIRYMLKLERWKERHKHQVIKWFQVIGKFEALSSYACFAFNHPSFIMPDITEDERIIHSKALGHPLLFSGSRVDNDFEINSKGRFVIITGPNMAGKSTFLRAAGVNLVLAMSGAPVCATHFSFRIIDLFSSMRTSDSLQKGESYFYAELKRLQAIIVKLKEEKNLFVILDEILKGTNSKDKEAGSKAFMRQMIEFGGTGIIATHDLSLCEIEKEFPDVITNKSFEVDIEGKTIHFDYILRDGVTTKMNATFLMEQMGIIKNNV